MAFRDRGGSPVGWRRRVFSLKNACSIMGRLIGSASTKVPPCCSEACRVHGREEPLLRPTVPSYNGAVSNERGDDAHVVTPDVPVRSPTRLATAMHEAGHAMVKLATPGASPIHLMTMRDLPEGVLGRVQTQTAWCPWRLDDPAPSARQREVARSLAWIDMMFFLAGPIAELRWRRNSRARLWLAAPELAERCLDDPETDSGSDLGRVRHILRTLHPGEERTIFIDAWLEAERLVARHLVAVEHLGRLLSECGELTGEEADEFWASFAANHPAQKSVKMERRA